MQSYSSAPLQGIPQSHSMSSTQNLAAGEPHRSQAQQHQHHPSKPAAANTTFTQASHPPQPTTIPDRQGIPTARPQSTPSDHRLASKLHLSAAAHSPTYIAHSCVSTLAPIGRSKQSAINPGIFSRDQSPRHDPSASPDDIITSRGVRAPLAVWPRQTVHNPTHPLLIPALARLHRLAAPHHQKSEGKENAVYPTSSRRAIVAELFLSFFSTSPGRMAGILVPAGPERCQRRAPAHPQMA